MYWGLEANLGLDRIGCTATPYTERQAGPSTVSQGPLSHLRKKIIGFKVFPVTGYLLWIPFFSPHDPTLSWVLCPACFVNHTQSCGVVCKVLVICWLGMLFCKKVRQLMNEMCMDLSFGGSLSGAWLMVLRWTLAMQMAFPDFLSVPY